MEVIIKSNYDEICQEAARIILEEWQKKRNLALGLATGATPLGVYKKIIELHQKGEIDFTEVVTFSLDEYLGLEKDHSQSFAFYMEENLFKHINIRKDNTVQILGIGRNGHIGFNEPGSSLSSRTRVKTLVEETVKDNARFFKSEEEVPRFCLTMGIGTVMEAKMIILLASGKNKSDAIFKSVEGPVTASIPASVLQLHPRVKILVDEEAGSLLSRRDYYKWVFKNKDRVKDYLK